MAQSIISTLNQPIIYRADDDVTCKCGERENCVLVTPNQQVYSQLKIFPCGTFTVCEQTLGDELVTNGDFASDLSGWTAGTGWVWEAGNACNSEANSLEQTIAISNGTFYQVAFEIVHYVSGTLDVYLGGNLLGSFTANGTYVLVVAAGAGTTIEFDSNPDFIGCIDNVSVLEITSCWDPDETDWHTSATGACHDSGNTTDLLYASSSFVTNTYYHVTIAVSGATAGGIKIVLGANVISPTTGTVTSGNGVFHFWGTSTGTTLKIRPTTDFDGCISDLTVDKYCNLYQFHLVPAEGDEFEIADMSAFYSLNEDIYNLTDFHFSDIFIRGKPLHYGCYKLCLVDCCTEQQTESSLLRNGNFSDGYLYWTIQNGTISLGHAVFIAGFTNSLSQNLISTHDADCVEISFDYIQEGTATVNVYIDGVLVDSPFLAGIGTYTNTFSNVPAGALITFSTGVLVDSIIIDNISVIVPEQCQPLYDQCTNCINYQESFQCTKLVEGFCDGNALGFAFDDASGNNYFKLSLRVKAELLHPTYEQDQEDYDFSTGNSSLSFGQSTKFQSLTFFPIPEYKHDVIALEKVCDSFQIDTADYFVKKGDYTPEWNKSSSTDLAPSRIDVKKKSETLFNTNCS